MDLMLKGTEGASKARFAEMLPSLNHTQGTGQYSEQFLESLKRILYLYSQSRKGVGFIAKYV